MVSRGSSIPNKTASVIILCYCGITRRTEKIVCSTKSSHIVRRKPSAQLWLVKNQPHHHSANSNFSRSNSQFCLFCSESVLVTTMYSPREAHDLLGSAAVKKSIIRNATPASISLRVSTPVSISRSANAPCNSIPHSLPSARQALMQLGTSTACY
jgi:hypothetical protein